MVLPDVLEYGTQVTWFRARINQWDEDGWYRPINNTHGLFVGDIDSTQETVENGLVSVEWNKSVSHKYELPNVYWFEAYGNNLG